MSEQSTHAHNKYYGTLAIAIYSNLFLANEPVHKLQWNKSYVSLIVVEVTRP